MNSTESSRYILVTGATGFIGAHVVDALLDRGIRVRAAVRNLEKGEQLRKDRERVGSRLDIVQIEDFTNESSLDEAVRGVDGIVHVASPFRYDIQDNENDLVRPAINGVKSVLQAAAKNTAIKRVVITSSFASVLDIDRKAPPHFCYTASDWNPQSYAESIDKTSTAVVAYRGSKKFAELAAWSFVKEQHPTFDITTLCPPMTFGPIVHPETDVSRLNESNATLWQVASGKAFPQARVPFWVDVRDLAQAHVRSLLRPEFGSKRYTVASPEKFSYQLAADIIGKNFAWAKDRIVQPAVRQEIDDSHDLDGATAARELGVTYRTFEESVTDLIAQAVKMQNSEVARP